MGAAESKPLSPIREAIATGIAVPLYKAPSYKYEYNLLTSFYDKDFALLDEKQITRYLGIEKKPELPKYMDLRPDLPPVLKCGQGWHSMGVVVSLLHYQLLHQTLPVFPPSRSFIYNNMDFYGEKHPKLYSFTTVFNSILTNGFPSENDCPNLDTPITPTLKEKAEGFRFLQIYRVSNDIELLKLLISEREPVLANLTVYYDLGNISSQLLMPDEKEKPLGGMGFLLVGYLDERQSFIGMSAMGTGFGTSGYVLIPFDYIQDSVFCNELYIARFHRNRVEGYIQQRRQMRNTVEALENPDETTKQKQDVYKKDNSTNIFG